MQNRDRINGDDIDYCFTRLSADQLARYWIGDVRTAPTAEQVAGAQKILDKTGALYRLVAGFRIEDWSHKPHAEVD